MRNSPPGIHTMPGDGGCIASLVRGAGAGARTSTDVLIGLRLLRSVRELRESRKTNTARSGVRRTRYRRDGRCCWSGAATTTSPAWPTVPLADASEHWTLDVD